MKKNKKALRKVYRSGKYLFKDFGNDVNEAKNTLALLKMFRASAGTSVIHGYSITATDAWHNSDKSSCIMMPCHNGVTLDNLPGEAFFDAVITVSSWLASHLDKKDLKERDYIHGDLHAGNIILLEKQKRIVFIDALCREATPRNIWLDLLLLSVSIALKLDSRQLKRLQHRLFGDIILQKAALAKRRLMMRQALVLGRFFLRSENSLREKLQALHALMLAVKNFHLMMSYQKQPVS